MERCHHQDSPARNISRSRGQPTDTFPLPSNVILRKCTQPPERLLRGRERAVSPTTQGSFRSQSSATFMVMGCARLLKEIEQSKDMPLHLGLNDRHKAYVSMILRNIYSVRCMVPFVAAAHRGRMSCSKIFSPSIDQSQRAIYSRLRLQSGANSRQ